MDKTQLRQRIIDRYGSLSAAARENGINSQRLSQAVLGYERGHKITTPTKKMLCSLLGIWKDELEVILNETSTTNEE